ncbi:MAG: sulfate transporter CysZ [Nitrospiria bacterium]
MRGNPFTGAGYLFRGLHLIRQPGIRQYVVIPLAINSLLFSLLIWFGAGQFNDWITRLLPPALDWLEWLLWPLFAITVSVILFFTFIHLGNLVAAPFNGLLAEAVEAHLKGHRAKESLAWGTLIKQLGPVFLSELKKIGYFLSRALPLLILFLIPVVNVVAPLLWMFFSAWMLALEYADYPMGNHDLLFPEQRRRLKEKGFTVLGFGGAALLILMVPFLNFIAIPTAVAGATVMWVDGFEKEKA